MAQRPAFTELSVVEDKIALEEIITVALAGLHADIADDPLFLLDLGEVVKSYRRFRELLPNVEVFYAVKCNDHPAIATVLASLGSKFDCASKAEIEMILALPGALPSDIIYANTDKYSSHLKYAEKVGVDFATFDNVLELDKVKRLHPRTKLVLRIAGLSRSPLQMRRFGAYPEEIETILRHAKDLELNVVGVTFHVGSFILDKETFVSSIQQASAAMEMATAMGFQMSILDIGGGFPSPISQEESFVAICDAVKATIAEHFGNTNALRVIAEPGYAIVKSCGTHVLKVLSKREKREVDNENGTHVPVVDYVINDSTFCTMRVVAHEGKVFQNVTHPLSEGSKQRPCRLSALWGYTCSSADMIKDRIMFPDVDCEEHVYVGGRGAYGLSLATKFNGYGNVNTKLYIRKSMASSIILKGISGFTQNGSK